MTICPECGSDDIFDSGLRESASYRCESCGHWFDGPEEVDQNAKLLRIANHANEAMGGAFNNMPFFVNDPKTLADCSPEDLHELHKTFTDYLDSTIEGTHVLGANPPEWQIAAVPCASGCHVNVLLRDEANDFIYLIDQQPAIVAAMSGLIDAEGNLHPNVVRAELRKREAALN